MSGMCEKCRIGIGRENRNRVRMETTGMFPVWDQVIEKRSAGSHCVKKKYVASDRARREGV